MSTCASRALSALMDVRVEMPRCARSHGAMGQKVVYNRVKCVKKAGKKYRACGGLRSACGTQTVAKIWSKFSDYTSTGDP